MAHHSGPGLRAVLWVQGCSLLCTRVCLNPDLLDAGRGFHVEALAAAEHLLRALGNYAEAEGVTILGGEPFDQAAALAEMLTNVRKAGYSTMVYSGHRYEELRIRGGAAAALLSVTDILVDGPFLESLYDGALIWRGSSNQRIIPLTSRYSEGDILAAQGAQGRAQFVSYGAAGDVVVSGLQSRAAGAAARRSALGGDRVVDV
jgi:anaerobic ribonucleoside-triphosphate reductase activating protein